MYRDRYRLIASIVGLYMYLLFMFPWQTILFTIIIVGMYFLFKNFIPDSDINNSANHRKAALREAKIYLSPYSNIWKNLKLSNSYCSLRLGSDGSTITGINLKHPEQKFKIIHSKVYTNNVLWDMFCVSFDHKTTYERLIELCETYKVDISINGEEKVSSQVSDDFKNGNKAAQASEINIDINDNLKEKLDINNASEVELTALPGINIVLAKRIIKKRDEMNGFKDVNEFLQFIQLKSHMEMQLRDMVCVKKMQGKKHIMRNKERRVDL